LFPFLAILKDHLEEFQVFLGKVESWLMGSDRSAVFMLKTFNVPVILGLNIILKTIACPQHDYNLSFDVSITSGQEKLTKFLAFITHIDKSE